MLSHVHGFDLIGPDLSHYSFSPMAGWGVSLAQSSAAWEKFILLILSLPCPAQDTFIKKKKGGGCFLFRVNRNTHKSLIFFCRTWKSAPIFISPTVSLYHRLWKGPPFLGRDTPSLPSLQGLSWRTVFNDELLESQAGVELCGSTRLPSDETQSSCSLAL